MVIINLIIFLVIHKFFDIKPLFKLWKIQIILKILINQKVYSLL